MDGVSSAEKENFRFQIIVVTVGIALFAAKTAAYLMTNSVAIFTDAAESIVNVVAGIIGLYALYISPKPPDREHPYGHGRAEVISAAAEGMMIMGAGVIIMISAVDGIMNPKPIRELDIGILVIFAAAMVNLAVGTAAIRRGRRNRSQALEASGRHLRTDTIDSLGIIVGLIAVYAGMRLGYDIAWLDPVIAIIFGVLIMSAGIKVLKGCIDTVMARAEDDVVDTVVKCINSKRHDDWVDVHNLRIMRFGTRYVIEMHATFPRDMTIGRAEQEMKELLEALKTEFGDSAELIIKPEPCRGFSCPLCARDCSYREHPFSSRIEWTADTMVQRRQHNLEEEG